LLLKNFAIFSFSTFKTIKTGTQYLHLHQTNENVEAKVVNHTRRSAENGIKKFWYTTDLLFSDKILFVKKLYCPAL
jgi:hypothetical protein